MDGNSYYQNLLQQGYSTTDAANFTKQYYPDFQSPVQGMGMMAPPPSPADLGVVASAGAAAPTSVSGSAMELLLLVREQLLAAECRLQQSQLSQC